MSDLYRGRTVLTLLKNLSGTVLLYICILGIIQGITGSSISHLNDIIHFITHGRRPPHSNLPEKKVDIISRSKDFVTARFEGSDFTFTINPHANVFNRPSSLIPAVDDYLGPRPHDDTEVNYEVLSESCQDPLTSLNGLKAIRDCWQFLAAGSASYEFIPETGQRGSDRHYDNEETSEEARTHGANARDELAAPMSYTFLHPRKPCSGPIVPYHAYWRGPSNWRLELFVKSYLFTQNIACSKLHLWLDADYSATAVQDMLLIDQHFVRFLPFVEQGHLVLQSWHFPSRIPLPKGIDHSDGMGYYDSPVQIGMDGDTAIASNIIEDVNGQLWLKMQSSQVAFPTASLINTIRFVVLHLRGGIFLDTDVIMLRDLRPLALPKNHSVTERWTNYPTVGRQNTGFISLPANSSLSSYFVRGGVRMGMNFHPLVLGHMAWKDGRDTEMTMLDIALFDPLRSDYGFPSTGLSLVPYLAQSSRSVFRGTKDALRNEWRNYVPDMQEPLANSEIKRQKRSAIRSEMLLAGNGQNAFFASVLDRSTERSSLGTFTDVKASLHAAGLIEEYDISRDAFPPTNRTLANFFRGAYTYNMHSSELYTPDPSSWLQVIGQAHDGFFAGEKSNPYGEQWDGPSLAQYDFWERLS